jgi:hypothetical protein
MTHKEAEGRDHHDYAKDDSYREWDAAYVLGALSPAERREFEEHIKQCEPCSNAVAELAAMPGLLGSLLADDALDLLGLEATEIVTPDPTSATSLHRLTARARRCRRIQTWSAGIAGVTVAAATFAGASVMSDRVNPPAQPSISVPLQKAVPGPLTANLALTSVEWGTKIRMSCDYHVGPGPGGGSPPSTRIRYGLYVTDHAGTETRVSSWTSSPGETVTVAGSIDVPLSDITALDVRSLDSGTVLLEGRTSSIADAQ